jgi:hypothetical protein
MNFVAYDGSRATEITGSFETGFPGFLGTSYAGSLSHPTFVLDAPVSMANGYLSTMINAPGFSIPGTITSNSMSFEDQPNIPTVLLKRENAYLNKSGFDKAEVTMVFFTYVTYKKAPVVVAMWDAWATWKCGTIWNSVSDTHFDLLGVQELSQNASLSSLADSANSLLQNWPPKPDNKPPAYYTAPHLPGFTDDD